jgi:hypothetical protein
MARNSYERESRDGTCRRSTLNRIVAQSLRRERELKRQSSITNSLIFDLASSAMSRLVTIRVFSCTAFYVKRMNERIDNQSTAQWSLAACTQWRQFPLGMLSAAFITVVVGVFVKSNVDAGVVGLTLTFALGYAKVMAALVQKMSVVEIAFCDVERVLEYTSLPTEPSDGGPLPNTVAGEKGAPKSVIW